MPASRGILESMSSLRHFLAVSALVVLVLPAAALAQERPDFSGVWAFNEKRSDDLRTKIEEAVGPDATTGDAKKDLVRVWIRRWLMSVIENPENQWLTVEQSEKDFKSGLGDEVSIYYFGREAASRGPLGGTLRVSVAWEGTQLRTTERSDDGGRITAVYTILPPGDTLLVALLLEHKTLLKPLEVAMFFERDEEEDE